jgi:DNA-binding MarR family transcriptional regulator
MSAIFDALSEPASERITAGLARIGLAIRSRAWKGAGTAGLTPTQAQVLALLRGRRQGLSLSAVAEALSVTAPTASDAVASLVAKGLLSKSRGADRRAVV